MKDVQLSILMCTVPSRRQMMGEIWDKLQAQAKDKPVQMISLCDNQSISVGQKRQYMMDMAAGKYLTYVDDDDDVADCYVDRILDATKEDPDVIVFPVHCTINGGQEGIVDMSLKYVPQKRGDPLEEYKPPITRRPPHELAVWKSSIARQATFADWWGGEDYEWAEQVWPLCKTEQAIPDVMYYYRYNHALALTAKGVKSCERQ